MSQVKIDPIRTAETFDNLVRAYSMVQDAFSQQIRFDYEWNDRLHKVCEEIYNNQNENTDLEDVRDDLFTNMDDEAFDDLTREDTKKALAFAEFRMSRAEAVAVFSELAGESAENFGSKYTNPRLHDWLHRKCSDSVLNARNEYEDLS